MHTVHPMKIYTKPELIAELNKIRDAGFVDAWAKNRKTKSYERVSAHEKKDGAVGDTLEYLLGIPTNNLPLPNAGEWEIKAQRLNTGSLTTLCHIEPSPRACSLVPKVFLPIYGWAHSEAGKKYPSSERRFSATISATNVSDRGFSIRYDEEQDRVVVCFDASKVDERHSEWLKGVLAQGGEKMPECYWGLADLYCTMGTKLVNCFYAKAEKRALEERVQFHYQQFFMLRNFAKNRVADAIKSGAVLFDFDARTGHNHGTKVRCRADVIQSLYEESSPF